MRSLSLALMVGVLASTAFLLQPSAGAQPAKARVIDRTLRCSTVPSGGVYEIEARAHPGVRESGSSKWMRLSSAVIATGRVDLSAGALENSLAWITAGPPDSRTTIGYDFYREYVLPSGTVAVNRRLCTSTTASVPLSADGLQGGSPGPLGEVIDCATPRRVLVRVRAVLQAPSKLRQRRDFLRTTEPATEASAAVRTESGRPLVYATVAAAGKARLFTAKRCTPD